MDFKRLNVQTRGRHVTSCLNIVAYLNVGRDNSVGTATRCGPDGLGIEVRWGPYFPQTSKPDLGLITQAPALRKTMHVSRLPVLIFKNKHTGLKALLVYRKILLYSLLVCLF
jgi:hypothetical protein